VDRGTFDGGGAGERGVAAMGGRTQRLVFDFAGADWGQLALDVDRASAAAPEVGARVRGGCARVAGGNELGADGGMDRARRIGGRWVPLTRPDQRAGGRSLGSGVEQPQSPPQRELFFFA